MMVYQEQIRREKNFRHMIEQVKNDIELFSAVMVKDVTRFARDYIRA